MSKQNWKCRDCKTFTLSEAGNYLHKVGEDYRPTISRVKICSNASCGRIYDANGNDKLVNNEKVYLRAGRIIILEKGEEVPLAMPMLAMM